MGYYTYDRIKEISAHLSILKRNIKQDIIELNKERAKQYFLDLFLLIQEAHFQKGHWSELEILFDVLDLQLERLENVQEKEQLEAVIERVTGLFENGKHKDQLSSARECNLYSDLISELELQLPIVDQIKNERPLNILAYDIPNEWAKSKRLNDERINSYGILINNGYYNKDYIDNVAHGVGGSSNITNGAFDVMIIAPPSTVRYDPIGIRNDIIPKKEYMALSTSLKYLRTGGLVSIIMPYTRLDMDLSTYIARVFSDIKIVKLDKILVEICGIKKTDKVLDKEAYNALRGLYKNFRDLPTDWSQYEKYELPQQLAIIQSFRGSRITDSMLENARSKSTAFSKVLNACKAVDDISNHKPLLPFNTGQVGLVLASGCLDGVVDEDEEHCHLIKGRVERKTEVVKGKRGADDTITVYHSVQINALTPDGKLIEIS